MEKIKSVLHGHKKSEDVPRDSHTSSSTTAADGQQHPIYDEMHHGHSVAAGKPHYDIKTTSGEPYTTLAHPGTSAAAYQAEHAGHSTTASDYPTATTGHPTTTDYNDHNQSTNQTHAKDGGNASIVPQKIQEKLPESVERAVPNAIHDTGDKKHDYDNPSRSHDTTGTALGGSHRPDASPTGGVQHTDMSTASIKSGVIGFGPGQRQGHAALSTHNPTQQYLDRDQVVGGGEPGSAGMTEGQGLRSSPGTQPTSQLGVTGNDRTTGGLGTPQEHQPYENTLRQESYTADTDRAFPLAGGVTSQHHNDPATSARHPTEHVSPLQHSTEPTSTLHQSTINEREPRDGHGREALAGAAAAATAVGASQSRSHPEERDVHEQGRAPATHSTDTHNTHPTSHSQTTEDEGILAKGKRLLGLGTSTEHHGHKTDSDNLGTHHAAHSDVPSGTAQPGSATSRTTQDHHPEALAAATAAAAATASKSSHPNTSAQEHPIGTQNRGLAGDTAYPVSDTTTGNIASERPFSQRTESHQRHIPGAFIATPGEHGNTFLDYTTVIQPTHGSSVEPSSVVNTSTLAAPTGASDLSHGHQSSTDPHSSVGQHELRHTGTLEEPQPRSSSEHHHGGDAAAVAGGLGGAAGLGYAASQKHDTPDVGSSNKPMYEESSPYSSKTLDPRVLGTKAKLEEQRFDPRAKTEHSPHHPTATSSSAGLSTGPSATNTSTRADDPQHHYGRDAALVGAGAATGAGLHHSAQRNDTPGAGTAVLPQESSYSSGPSSSTPQQSTNVSAPYGSSTISQPQQRSVGQDTFYGTAGAPAPIADQTSHFQQPQGNPGHGSSYDSAAKDSDHHYGRDAGLAGAGALGAGGLYAATRNDHNNTAPTSSTSNSGLGPSTAPTSGAGLTSATGPSSGTGLHSNDGFPSRTDGTSNTGPASKTVGPHSSNVANVLDPRVKPDPAQQASHRADPSSNERSAQQGDHHYGRDAAAVGGLGAAGYGAHEAAQAYGDHRMTQPTAAMNEQRYDPTARGANAPSPVPAKSEYNYNDPTIHSNVNRPDQTSESHTGRNAALGGAGLAAAGVGAGAYASSKHDNNTQQLPLHQKEDFASSTAPGSTAQSSYPSTSTYPTQSSHPTQGVVPTAYPTQGTTQAYPTQGASQAYPTQGTTAQQTSQPYGATHDPADQSHDKRNAALLGAGGAAAVGGGAYALSQQQDEKERARLAEREQERLKKEAHDREKEQHKLDKEQHKHDKEAHKHEKAVAAHEKEQAHLQKEHEKEQHRLAKEQHAREKEAEKEAHRHEKETEGEEKKKGGLLGFLHRDKSKKEKSANSPDSSPRQSGERARHSRDSPRHSKEYAAGALGAGTTAAAYDDDHPDSPRWKGRNLLHKDPPIGHPAREALEHQHEGEFSGKREHVGVDGPIGNPNMISGDRETRKGVYGAHPVDDLSHDKRVIEPHTGLPMNIGRYGTGSGGTDGNTTIHGHHTHDPSGATGLTGTSGVHDTTGAYGTSATHGTSTTGATGAQTDFDAIKKADTLY